MRRERLKKERTQMKRAVKYMIATLTIAIAIFAFAACNDNNGGFVYEGTDVYGRTLGEIYDIDSEDTGVFSVPYEIGGTSAIGKTMISANCADYVTVEKTQSGYTLTFYCDDGMLGSVKVVRGSGKTRGKRGAADGYQSFTFGMTREELDSEISLECEVKIMNKVVEFSLTCDLSKAKLVG